MKTIVVLLSLFLFIFTGCSLDNTPENTTGLFLSAVHNKNYALFRQLLAPSVNPAQKSNEELNVMMDDIEHLYDDIAMSEGDDLVQIGFNKTQEDRQTLRYQSLQSWLARGDAEKRIHISYFLECEQIKRYTQWSSPKCKVQSWSKETH